MICPKCNNKMKYNWCGGFFYCIGCDHYYEPEIEEFIIMSKIGDIEDLIGNEDDIKRFKLIHGDNCKLEETTK